MAWLSMYDARLHLQFAAILGEDSDATVDWGRCG